MRLIFPGEPTPKQSARFRIMGKGKKQFISSYQTKAIKDSAKKITIEAKSQIPSDFKPFNGPIEIDVLFVFPLLKGFSKKKVQEIESGIIYYKDTKPDLDNTQKNILDPLEGLVYTNDSRICRTRAEKIYGIEPRTEITITKIE